MLNLVFTSIKYSKIIKKMACKKKRWLVTCEFGKVRINKFKDVKIITNKLTKDKQKDRSIHNKKKSFTGGSDSKESASLRPYRL